jgi:hypothetical protein
MAQGRSGPADDSRGALIFYLAFPRNFWISARKIAKWTFPTRLGRLVVKARFDPAEMMYHGKLAV